MPHPSLPDVQSAHNNATIAYRKVCEMQTSLEHASEIITQDEPKLLNLLKQAQEHTNNAVIVTREAERSIAQLMTAARRARRLIEVSYRMPTTERQKADEEVIQFAKHWARFRFAVSDINTIEVTIKAYDEVVAEGVFEKSAGTYYVTLEVPKVVPTILLEIFKGRGLMIQTVFYEEKNR